MYFFIDKRKKPFENSHIRATNKTQKRRSNNAYVVYVVVEHEVLVGWIGRTLLVAKRST